jgi:hypothetical protein
MHHIKVSLPPVDPETANYYHAHELKEKIKALEEIGRRKGAVDYKASVLIALIMFVQLMKKYGGNCLVTNITRPIFGLGFSINSDSDKSQIRTFGVYQKLGESLAECIRRGVQVICIYVELEFGDTPVEHINMLIYRPFKRIIERFEPHGSTYPNSIGDNVSFNQQLKQLWEVDLNQWIGDVHYRPPHMICPHYEGFQSIEENIKMLASEGGGFCNMWSIFIAEMILMNPRKSTDDILEEVFLITKKDPMYLRSVIRGYVIEAEKGVDSLIKTMGEKGFSFAEWNIFTQTIGLHYDDLNEWFLNSIFSINKYNYDQPNYTPLPKTPTNNKNTKYELMETYYNKMKGVTFSEIETMYDIYSEHFPFYGRKEYQDIAIKNLFRELAIKKLLESLIDGKPNFSSNGENSITDIDIILEQELHKKKGGYKYGMWHGGRNKPLI